MRLKETSFTYNVTTKGSATPDFTQDIGQSRFHYMSQEGFNDIAVAMLYYKVDDIENIEVPLGKGGRKYNLYNLGDIQSECVIASVFNNIYVNGVKLEGQQLVMFVLKDINPQSPHFQRRQLKFSRLAKYNNSPINESCIAAITKALGCKDSGSWIVVSMDVTFEESTEPILFLTAVVVDKDNHYDFENVQLRSNFIHKHLSKEEGKGKASASAQAPKTPVGETKQQISYGAPGTGKSHGVKAETEQWEPLDRVVRTTFHPDSDYSTFVGAYKPTMEYMPIRNSSGLLVKTNGSTTAIADDDKDLVREKQITYRFVPQAFLQAYVAAWINRSLPEFLVIEEINRGNCAQIFGDLFQLLDRATSGYSEYPIKADKDLEAYLKEAFKDVDMEDYPKVKEGKELLLPDNLYIRATMNTSDQSLFPIDSAFKRRWDWQYVPIHNVSTENYKVLVDADKYDWWKFVEEINKRILKTTSSEDKQLGYFFCKANNEKIITAETFVSKVVFYIWNDIFKDYEFSDDAFIDYKDESGKVHKLEFKDFYGADANGKTVVITAKIKKFMENLGIKPENDIVPSDDFSDDLDDDNDDDNSTPNLNSSRDTSRYSVNGEGSHKKSFIAAEIMRRYVNDNAALAAEAVVESWKPFEAVFGNMVRNEASFNEFLSTSKDVNAARRYSKLSLLNGESVYVSNQWNPDRLRMFSEKLQELGWPYSIAKVSE